MYIYKYVLVQKSLIILFIMINTYYTLFRLLQIENEKNLLLCFFLPHHNQPDKYVSKIPIMVIIMI